MLKKIFFLIATFLGTTIHPVESCQIVPADEKDLFEDKSWIFWNRDYAKKICDILESGQSVVLAVVGEEFLCSNAVIPDPERRETFLKSVENDILNMFIKKFLSDLFFSENSNFALVDRTAVVQILDELKFQKTGYVTKEMRDELGHLLGVTHLLMISFSRGKASSKPEGYLFSDDVTVKLVELKLGKILTLETCSSHFINDRFTKRTKNHIYSTNIKDYTFVESE